MSNVFLGQISMFGGNFAPRGFCLLQRAAAGDRAEPGAVLAARHDLWRRRHPDLRAAQSAIALADPSGPGTGPVQLYSRPDRRQRNGDHRHVDDADPHSRSQRDDRLRRPPPRSPTTVLPGQPTGAGSPPKFYAAQAGGPAGASPAYDGCRRLWPAGGSQPHTNLMPSLCITFIIALQGIFPSRN